MVDETLLSLLRCPKSKGELQLVEQEDGEPMLWCKKSKLAYPIREGVPRMLVEEAQEMAEPPSGS